MISADETVRPFPPPAWISALMVVDSTAASTESALTSGAPAATAKDWLAALPAASTTWMASTAAIANVTPSRPRPVPVTV